MADLVVGNGGLGDTFDRRLEIFGKGSTWNVGMGKTIAVVNQKGGVGKTTTAVSLAAGLALAERRTLLVDLDPQGNATSGAGITRTGLTTDRLPGVTL